MNQYSHVVNQAAVSVNDVLRKTYALLSLTVLFSAVVVTLTLYGFLPFPRFGLMINLILTYGLLFLLQACRKSRLALFLVFAFTGYLGYTLTPFLAACLVEYSNGAALVGTAFVGTAVTFLALSAYAIVSKKDFSYLGGWLVIGTVVTMLCACATMFLKISVGALMIDAALMLISAGWVLYDTNRIVRGGESDYVMLTVCLFISFYNLLVTILDILSHSAGRRD